MSASIEQDNFTPVLEMSLNDENTETIKEINSSSVNVCENTTESAEMDLIKDNISTENEFSNNASADGPQNQTIEGAELDTVVSKQEAVTQELVDQKIVESDEHSEELKGQVNMAFEIESDGESEDVFHVVTLDRSRSDEHLELKHQWKTRELVENLKDSPTAVSEVNSKDYVEIKDFQEHGTPEVLAYPDSSCTESPGITSQDDVTYEDGDEDDDDYYIETAGDERMSLIEEEYIDRITLLERRNYDLEMVLHRLTPAMERLLSLSEDEGEKADANDDIETDDVIDSEVSIVRENETEKVTAEKTTEDTIVPNAEVTEEVKTATEQTEQEIEVILEDAATEKAKEKVVVGSSEAQTETREDTIDSTARCVSRHICIELFMEFQKKLAMFAGELKGVLNCSESAIRHGRVVQEWGKSVQLMFEQLLHERKKMMNFIEEREQVMMQSREQFIAEKQEQGRQLQHLVEEMKTYRDLMETTESICRDRAVESSHRRSISENVVDLLLHRRLEEERAIILGLARQSKISEMKLFIMHQQNCIQDLQIQNKELRAVIEGLVGPDDLDEEQGIDTDQSGTPASLNTPEHSSVRETLDKVGSQPISLVSDVLHCDRGQYLPGSSTDGDLATIQAYDIGQSSVKVGSGEDVVFDPLSVDYVREHCQQAEETERRALAAQHDKDKPTVEDGHQTPETDRDVMVIQDGVQALNIEPYLRKCAEAEKLLAAISDNQDAAGDGIDVINQKQNVVSPEKTEVTSQRDEAENITETECPS